MTADIAADFSKMTVEEIEHSWNYLQMQITPGSPNIQRLIAAEESIILALETAYRRPWDEVIYFKIIQMQLKVAEHLQSKKVLGKVGELLKELELSCPIMPKQHKRKFCELRGESAALNFQISMKESAKRDQGSILAETAKVMFEFKRDSVPLGKMGKSLLSYVTESRSIEQARRLESLVPECSEFREFRVDLLNVLTELYLEEAITSRRNASFSSLITEAINANVRSLNVRPNVMGYFEFLKLTKLQDPNGFHSAIETCLTSIATKVAASEDVNGRIQIIRLIFNETEDCKMALDCAKTMFSNADWNVSGPMIFGCLLENIIYESSCDNVEAFRSLLEESVLDEYEKVLIASEKCRSAVERKLLRLAERSMTFRRKNDAKRAEILILAAQKISKVTNNEISNLQLAKCLMKSEQWDRVEELICNQDGSDWKLIVLELALRRGNECEALELISSLRKDSSMTSEHYFNLYVSLKRQCNLSLDLQLNLLRAAQEKLTSKHDEAFKIDLLRGIMAVMYEGIVSSGFEAFREKFEKVCQEFQACEEATLEQCQWFSQVAWNVGVIHAKSEDFSNASMGFLWCHRFGSRARRSTDVENDLTFKGGFYYLTAKVCQLTDSEKLSVEDWEILKDCKEDIALEKDHLEFREPLKLLEVELLLQDGRWQELQSLIENLIRDSSSLTFSSMAEIVLKSHVECPIEIHHLVLKLLTEGEFEQPNFDIGRFAILFRGLIMSSMLLYPHDLSYFQAAFQMVKTSFGRYPMNEVVWLCGTAYNMALENVEDQGNWSLAGEWIEMALNLLYLVNEDSKGPLEKRIRLLFSKIIDEQDG